jgi:hypothetical protein
MTLMEHYSLKQTELLLDILLQLKLLNRKIEKLQFDADDRLRVAARNYDAT